LAEVLDALSPEDELTLGLAMGAALPVLEQLSRHAAPRRRHWRATAALIG
jgi:hypothetical protein